MIFTGKNFLTAIIVNYVAELTPRCHDITRLLSEGLDRKLPWRVRAKLHLHYSICVWCERYGKQLHFVRDACRQVPEQVAQFSCGPLPPETKERIAQRLRQAA